MMSYFVKGGAPPKSCGNCPHNYSSLKCKITNSEIDRDDEYKERLSDCPIVEVKEPHGNLVDFDQMVEDYWDGALMVIDERKFKQIESSIIIEPEGREE